MKIVNATFQTSAHELAACPDSELPEFAFIGRSNVGKSSLINMLTARKDLAKTSSTPGKTKLINYFLINNNWSLVDLPGYGYAKVGKDKKVIFNEIVSEFFLKRKNLKHIFLLVDCRNEPQLSDMEFVDWLDECKLPYSIVFTKTDKVSSGKTIENMEHFCETMQEWEIALPEIFKTSSKSKEGRTQILAFIDKFVPKKQKHSKKKADKNKKEKPAISLHWMNR